MHAKDDKRQVSSVRIPHNDGIYVGTPIMSRSSFALGT